MLFKILLTDKSNFEKSLKNRRLAAIGLLCVGLTGFACYFLLVPDSDQTQHLITHPAARKKAQIQETDERTVYIIRTAFQAAGCITFFTAAAALFVVLPLSMAAFQALFSMIVLYSVSFAASNWLLSRKV